MRKSMLILSAIVAVVMSHLGFAQDPGLTDEIIVQAAKAPAARAFFESLGISDSDLANLTASQMLDATKLYTGAQRANLYSSIVAVGTLMKNDPLSGILQAQDDFTNSDGSVKTAADFNVTASATDIAAMIDGNSVYQNGVMRPKTPGEIITDNMWDAVVHGGTGEKFAAISELNATNFPGLGISCYRLVGAFFPAIGTGGYRGDFVEFKNIFSPNPTTLVRTLSWGGTPSMENGTMKTLTNDDTIAIQFSGGIMSIPKALSPSRLQSDVGALPLGWSQGSLNNGASKWICHFFPNAHEQEIVGGDLDTSG